VSSNSAENTVADCSKSSLAYDHKTTNMCPTPKIKMKQNSYENSDKFGETAADGCLLKQFTEGSVTTLLGKEFYKLMTSNAMQQFMPIPVLMYDAAGPVVQMMAIPSSMPGVPPGLEYLTQVDQLLVHQLVEVLERKC